MIHLLKKYLKLMRARRNACVIKDFHELYYYGYKSPGPIYQNTYWMGVPCLKCPLDLWIYQEILFEIKPDLIIETGTDEGGSALFLAQICDLLNHGHVATIDFLSKERPQHHRISYIQGLSYDEKVVKKALSCVQNAEKFLVILDSDHSEENVTRELDVLSPYVTPGSYIIVEDTNINGHPVRPEFGPGPFEAVQKFIKENDSFIIDTSREKFLMTFNPKGFLKKVQT